jgi:hypothetical protein
MKARLCGSQSTLASKKEETGSRLSELIELGLGPEPRLVARLTNDLCRRTVSTGLPTQQTPIGGDEMAKKKATRKKAAKRSRATKRGRPKPAKRRAPPSKPPKVKAPKPTIREPEYGPTFFLTSENGTSQAYEIDGTPHFKTVHSYRLEHAAIREFEEQDGKILYKVKPLKAPAG